MSLLPQATGPPVGLLLQSRPVGSDFDWHSVGHTSPINSLLYLAAALPQPMGNCGRAKSHASRTLNRWKHAALRQFVNTNDGNR